MDTELSEFETTLEKQGKTLCFPLDESLEAALRRHGFEEGQGVVMRLAPERLEIRPRRSPEAIRDKLLGAAGEVKELRERILAFMKDLPQASDEELEEDGSLEGELLGMLECLVEDNLTPAIVKLESVVKLGPLSASNRLAPAAGPEGKVKSWKPRRKDGA
ncbi:MAG TPA: hypothetical protein VKK31_09030 [Thermoanaerobaculia bacterium]|nr:hypothetical protein [Thermoanaerobaculia bacterium]